MRDGMGVEQPAHQLMDSGQDYMTGDQLAEMLQVSVKSVSRWASSDPSMPVLRIGRTVRFPRERVLRWLRSREQGMGRSKQSEKLLPSAAQPVDGQGNASVEHAACARS